MSAEHERELANELRAMRAEPRPEYVRELDRRAADWLRGAEVRRPRAWLRVAVPAVATAAAAAVALVLLAGGDGDETLGVRVVPEQGPAAGALRAAPEQDSAAAPPGAGAVSVGREVRPGQPVVIRYSLGTAARAHIELGSRETSADVPTGSGKLEVSTAGLEPGTYTLAVAIPPLRERRVRVDVVGR